MTRKEKVLTALTEARRTLYVTFRASPRAPRYSYIRCDDGWVDGHVLCHPALGGSEGLRRVRELRADGVDIEKRNHPDRGRSTVQYRLVPDTNRLFT